MNAVITIGSIGHFLMPLNIAIEVATALKEATVIDRKYSDTYSRYEVKNTACLIEIELATETEVSQWLS